ncbi:unnamed protein product [Mytilus coruscus]|uniref:Uncharacterized protein n=1 Tax=Mytilus coruscus TaxID=42192 RepID=A0A6J8B3X0_MYTCO|nr:unnamed protein product [Mytilus coruscus]
MELDEVKIYGEVHVCERNGRVHTHGNNLNFPGCEDCYCCSENGPTTAVSTNIELKKTTTFYTTDSGTKTTFAEILSTTSNSQNESQSLCACQCSSKQMNQSTKSRSHNYTTAELKQLLQEELREMSEQLRVQKNLTSAWVRARRSADDRRMISVGIGYVAIVIISMPFVLVVVSDCRKIR